MSEHSHEAELEVLNILWRRGPSTVRDVHEVLQADRKTAMTTTLKILQVMTEKGLTMRRRFAAAGFSQLPSLKNTRRRGF